MGRARKEFEKYARRYARGLRLRSEFGRHNAPPDFIVLGIQKGGTNAARYNLNLHPQIHIVQDEVHYFDKNYFLPLRWYQNHFVRSDGSLLNGEATPVYMSKKYAIDRIRVHYPDVKLIVFLREPIQRAFSKWNRMRQRNDEARVATKPFVRSVLDEDKKLLTNGFYAEHLEYILEQFPRENLHIAISERVLDRPAHEYQRIARFLDLPSFDFGASERKHPTTYKSELKEADVKLLFDVYAPRNQRFYELMDERIDEWEGFYRHHGLA